MAIRGASSDTTATNPRRPTRWQEARVVSIRAETPRVRTIAFALPDWPGHLPGQHADVRLTAPDGYRAERSYSIASPPGAPVVELTVDRLDDGEVSPFLTGELQVGDAIELRGPIGGYFVWRPAAASRPLLLIGGGSGVVPLMCMLRHRQRAASDVPAALLYSVRTRVDVIYGEELRALAAGDPRFELCTTFTRDTAPGLPGRAGRIDATIVGALLARLGAAADSFVCGGDGFVEAASALLMAAGQPRHAIRAERFGPSGL